MTLELAPVVDAGGWRWRAVDVKTGRVEFTSHAVYDTRRTCDTAIGLVLATDLVRAADLSVLDKPAAG